MTDSNTYDYSKEETNITYRRRTSATGGRIQTWFRPQIPCPLPGNTVKGRTPFQCGSRTETGCLCSVRIQLDQTICLRRNFRTEDKTGPGKPIMDCSDEALVRDAVSRERQSVKCAKEVWEKASGKRASAITFKRFLEVLAQDISVSPNAQGQHPRRNSMRLSARSCRNLKV